MSFEDWQNVTFDDEENTFTVLRNSGKTHTYDTDIEKDLAIRILEHPDDVDIYRSVHVRGYYRKSGYVRGYKRKNKMTKKS